MPRTPLRVAVIGAGKMGADHIQRIERRTRAAEIAAVVDVDLDRAKAAIECIPGASAYETSTAAFASGDVNAVLIATPSALHEAVLLEALELDIPILCEKPLTPDSASAWRVVEAEAALGRKRIQVGFMRRFDAGYRALRETIVTRELGELLMLHHRHRNANVPSSFTSENLINDSVVHEFDAVRFFTGEEIVSVQVRTGKRSTRAGDGLIDPQFVVMETESGVLADVEIFVTAQFGYEVATQAVFEDGVVDIGRDGGMYVRHAGRWSGAVTPGFVERFADAFDAEVQDWVDAAHRGEIGGSSAWDGYATAACCEAGVAAQHSTAAVAVEIGPKPEVYR